MDEQTKFGTTDDAIVEAADALGHFALTRGIAHRLRLPTGYTRRRLQRLEREGRVERDPTCIYITQICWRPTGK